MSPENSLRGPHGNSQTLLPSHLNPTNPDRSGASSPMNGEKAKRPKSSRNGSWDLLAGVGGRDFEEFDVRAGAKTLTYAEVSQPTIFACPLHVCQRVSAAVVEGSSGGRGGKR